MAAGDPIRDPKVVMAKGSGFMAAVLPQGMSAVALDISPESGAGGFILPEDRVDVVLTREDKAAEKATGVEKFVNDVQLDGERFLPCVCSGFLVVGREGCDYDQLLCPFYLFGSCLFCQQI